MGDTDKGDSDEEVSAKEPWGLAQVAIETCAEDLEKIVGWYCTLVNFKVLDYRVWVEEGDGFIYVTLSYTNCISYSCGGVGGGMVFFFVACVFSTAKKVMNVATEWSRKIQRDGFGKFAVKTCYFSRRKGPNPRMECDDLTSVWLSLIGSMVPHGCTWFAPPKSPQVQRVTKVLISF